jgi:hypothetical protein
VLTRNLAYGVRIENTGDTPVEPSLSGHYETEAGQVLEFAGVMCPENDLPYGTHQPGQFIEGGGSHDLPDDTDGSCSTSTSQPCTCPWTPTPEDEPLCYSPQRVVETRLL